MIILKGENGEILETCRLENFKEDYREVVAYAVHKTKQTGIIYKLEHIPLKQLR